MMRGIGGGSTRAPAAFGVVGVARLVAFIVLQDRAAAQVLGRQAPQVLVQVRLDLALGLHHEARFQPSPRRPAATPIA
jgi:hypothetical protein